MITGILGGALRSRGWGRGGRRRRVGVDVLADEELDVGLARVRFSSAAGVCCSTTPSLAGSFVFCTTGLIRLPSKPACDQQRPWLCRRCSSCPETCGTTLQVALRHLQRDRRCPRSIALPAGGLTSTTVSFGCLAVDLLERGHQLVPRRARPRHRPGSRSITLGTWRWPGPRQHRRTRRVIPSSTVVLAVGSWDSTRPWLQSVPVRVRSPWLEAGAGQQLRRPRPRSCRPGRAPTTWSGCCDTMSPATSATTASTASADRAAMAQPDVRRRWALPTRAGTGAAARRHDPGRATRRRSLGVAHDRLGVDRPAGGGPQHVGPHLAGALVAVERVLRQRLQHDGVDGRRDVPVAQARRLRRPPARAGRPR